MTFLTWNGRLLAEQDAASSYAVAAAQALIYARLLLSLPEQAPPRERAGVASPASVPGFFLCA